VRGYLRYYADDEREDNTKLNENRQIHDKKIKKSSSCSEKIFGNRFYPLIFLTIIVFVSVSLVMVVNNMTRVKILAEKDAAIISQLKAIFTDTDDYEPKKDYYIAYRDKQVIGFAFVAKGKGYGGEINIFVGLNTDFTIEQIKILSNTETPGLGTKITEDSFTGQFKGLSFKDVSLSKDGGKIDAITGATISSKAVTDAVRKELEEKIEVIKSDMK